LIEQRFTLEKCHKTALGSLDGVPAVQWPGPHQRSIYRRKVPSRPPNGWTFILSEVFAAARLGANFPVYSPDGGNINVLLSSVLTNDSSCNPAYLA
jgi:hypothetical protein